MAAWGLWYHEGILAQNVNRPYIFFQEELEIQILGKISQFKNFAK